MAFPGPDCPADGLRSGFLAITPGNEGSRETEELDPFSDQVAGLDEGAGPRAAAQSSLLSEIEDAVDEGVRDLRKETHCEGEGGNRIRSLTSSQTFLSPGSVVCVRKSPPATRPAR